MANSQQWRHAVFILPAILAVLFTGFADAYITHCASSYKDCNHNVSNGCETDVDVDVMNCGACGAVCKERDGYITSCNEGKCKYSDRCVVTDCLVEPNASSTCKLGRCKSICNAGYADFNGFEGKDGCETFVDSDVMNCGACGAVCKVKPGYFTNCQQGKCEYLDKCAAIRCAGWPNAPSTCKAGKCKVTCSSGYADCNHDLQKDGCEVDVKADIFNCGKCGHDNPTAQFVTNLRRISPWWLISGNTWASTSSKAAFDVAAMEAIGTRKLDSKANKSPRKGMVDGKGGMHFKARIGSSSPVLL